MQKYRVIAFDMDNTLVDDTKAREYAITKVAEYLQIPIADTLGKDFMEFDDFFWHEWEIGKIIIPKDVADWVTYIRSKRFQLFFKDYPMDIKKAETLYHIYSESIQECIIPLDGAKETLYVLKKKYKLCIATNGLKKLISKKLNVIEAEPFISYIVCSEDIGVNKPNKLFLDTLLQVCNVAKEEILLVGDSLISDILGGMENGIDTCWFNPNHLPLPQEYEPTMEIDHLLELTRKL